MNHQNLLMVLKSGCDLLYLKVMVSQNSGVVSLLSSYHIQKFLVEGPGIHINLIYYSQVYNIYFQFFIR